MDGARTVDSKGEGGSVPPEGGSLLEDLHHFLLASFLAFEKGGEEPALEIDVEAVRKLLQDREGLTKACAGLAVAFVAWLRRRNQFVYVSAGEGRQLLALFAKSLHAVAASGEEAGRDHARRLAAWLRFSLGGLPPEVPSAEYSAEFQLSILGLEPESLQSPVLDLGCGPSAKLINHLRGLGWGQSEARSAEPGIEAWGVDWASASEWVIGRDWLEFDYGEEKWGTVISHQAFSLHFLHHHFRPGEAAQRYGAAYMAILRGLRPGGVFAYVPALPFIEALLPEDYRVERQPLPEELTKSLEWVKERDPKLEVAFSVRVHRR